MVKHNFEKRLEFVTKQNNLRTAFNWQELIEIVGAKVISQISNQSCQAYLLSESSLFVFDNRVVAITCGATQLLKLLEITKDLGLEPLKFSYSLRGNFDLKDFELNIADLQKKYSAAIIHYSTGFARLTWDCLEIVPAREIFEIVVFKELRENEYLLSRLDQVCPGFTIDQHKFKPQGFSLNAIKSSEYYSLHISPEVGFLSLELSATGISAAIVDDLMIGLADTKFAILSSRF